MSHVGFMAMSQHRFDGMFDAAHLLKIASYAAMLTGLHGSYHDIFTSQGARQRMQARAEEDDVTDRNLTLTGAARR